MIEAKKSKLALWMFRRVQKQYVRKMFTKIYVKDNRNRVEDGLYIINHSTWWDALVVAELQFKGLLNDAYIMTDLKGMQKVPIFKYIGAYSIDKDDATHVLQSLRYTEDLLKSNRTVCIFPQGEEVHLEKRPLIFQQGVAMIARRVKDVPIFPITLYYTFRHTKKAEIWIEIGQQLNLDYQQKRQAINTHLETELTTQLDNLKEKVIHHKKDGFEQIL